MIPLATPDDYVRMLELAALFGAAGGLAFELLQVRQLAAIAALAPGAAPDTETGAIQIPHPLAGKALLFDLGFLASLIVGAVAAVAALYFFPPQITIQVAAADSSVRTITEYDMVKLVALALIVGSAGPSLLTSMQSRIQAALSQQSAAATQQRSDQQLAEIKEAAKEDAKRLLEEAAQATRPAVIDSVRQAAEAAPDTADQTTTRASGAVMDLIATLTEDATRKFEERIDRRVEEARKVIAAS